MGLPRAAGLAAALRSARPALGRSGALRSARAGAPHRCQQLRGFAGATDYGLDPLRWKKGGLGNRARSEAENQLGVNEWLAREAPVPFSVEVRRDSPLWCCRPPPVPC